MQATPKSATTPSRSVGIRDQVLGWLATHGDVVDDAGLSSALLARQVCYAGTSVAFAQLLSGMERAGLIQREVRGKRTYRISLTEQGRRRAELHAARRQRAASPAAGAGGGAKPFSSSSPARSSAPDGAEELDYDRLARRLLLLVARRLLQDEAASQPPEHGPVRLGGGQLREALSPKLSPEHPSPRSLEELDRAVRALEGELARARAARKALEEEYEQLRDQLERTRQSLGQADRPLAPRPRAQAQPTPMAEAQEVEDVEVALLQRVLAGGLGRAGLEQRAGAG